MELWRRLPAGPEPAIVAAAVPSRATILELGAGVGRMTHPLLDRGFRVTAVDESAQMLAHIHGAQTVQSSIEDLRLDRTYDVVLLASYLIHAGDQQLARQFLHTCRRHVDAAGCVLIQCRPEHAPEEVSREASIGAGGVARVVSSEPVGDGVQQVCVEYVFPDAIWTQTFCSRRISPEQFADELSSAGLCLDRHLTDDRTWALCRPTTADDR